MSKAALTLRMIAEACGGEAHGSEDQLDQPIAHVVIDDRKAAEGDLFIPIRGERFDGHDFIGRACEARAFAFISEREIDGAAVPWIHVQDSARALQETARLQRVLCDPLTVAVTGSAGKTTTKEMIGAVLEKRFRTVRTEGNLNNQTGVPLTLLRIGHDTEAAVVEMGMNHAGEIDRIAYAASPDIGVITNIGTAHIEHLGTREGILAAKCELLDHVRPGGRVFVNGDDDLLAEAARSRGLTTFGFNEENDIRAVRVSDKGLEGSEFDVETDDISFHVRIPAPGRYMVYAALAAAACGLEAGLTPEEIAGGIASYRPIGSRMRIVHGDFTVIDDTYNANAPAMKAALDVLAAASGPLIAVLGEMRELGDASASLHREVAEYAAALPLKYVVTVGEAYKGNVPDDERVLWFATQDDLLANIDTLVQPGDTVLVKASRGMHMENTVQHLGDLIARHAEQDGL